MARTQDLLVAAMLATAAVAMPAPQQKLIAKRSNSFTVSVQARQMRPAIDDIARVSAKYATAVQDVEGLVSNGNNFVNGINSIIGDVASSLGVPDILTDFALPTEAATAVPTSAQTSVAVAESTATAAASPSSPPAIAPSPPSFETSVTAAPVASTLSTVLSPATTATPTSALPATSSIASSTSAVQATASVAPATSTASGEEGQVTTTPEANDIEYLSPVTIGGQTLTLDFDTGSSDLWVYSSELPQSAIGNHSIYNPNQSSTFVDYPNATWSISYGDGSTASGSVGFDTVNVGGAVVNKQCVELANAISSSFLADTQSDGLLGLGFSSINTVSPQKQQTFFESIMPQLDQPVFTADLGDHAPGIYEFGAIDASKYTGNVYYTDVDSSAGYWTVSVPEYQINGQTFPMQATSAIADTGTSLLYLNQEVVDAYYKNVQGAGLNTDTGAYTFACGTQLPDFGISIGGYFATIKGADMTYEQLDGNQCFGGLQIQPNGASFQILGDMFLKQFLAVFDGGNLQFGVAERA